MTGQRIRETGVDRSAAWFVLNVAIGMAAFYVPAFLVPASIELMNGLIAGSLVLFAFWLVLPAETRFVTLAGRLAGLIAWTAAGLGAAGILTTARVAELVASPLLVAVYAMVFAVALLVAATWRPRGGMRRVDERSMTKRLFVRLIWIAIAIAFGGALAVTIDQAGERGTPHFAQAEVYARTVRSDHDGGVTRQLHVAPWGTQPATIFNVDTLTYDAFREGENICPQSHRGLLGIGWFRLKRCPSALRAVKRHQPHVGQWSRSNLGLLPLLLLISVGLLANAGGAVSDGRINDRDASYTRSGEPTGFWLRVAPLAGAGIILLIFVTVLGLLMLV